MRSLFILTISMLLVNYTLGQEIRLVNKNNPEKTKEIRLDKDITIRTFDGSKLKGPVTITDDYRFRLNEIIVSGDEIMMISGFVVRNRKEKTAGLGITIGAGLILPFSVYYILGGIAWAQPNGIFIGTTILFFDLLLAYVGTNLMGIFPRRFSTMNWEINIAATTNHSPAPLPLPIPSD